MPDRPNPTPHEPLPEPPEPRAAIPEPVRGHRAPDVALRATFIQTIRQADADRLEQFVERIKDEDAMPLNYLLWMEAAAVDLLNIAAALDYYADQAGDGVRRAEIPVAAAVLDVAPKVEQIGQRLRITVAAAREDGRS